MKKNIYLLFTLVFAFCFDSFSQGCVAIRNSGVPCTTQHPMDSSNSGWQFSLSYRYYKSFRHFKGRTEQKERLEKHTEVINLSSSVDISITRLFNNRWSLTVGLPYSYNDRSSLYEHGLKERHYSSSQGIGDLRIVASRWILNPTKSHKTNIQVGLGIKLPTGNFNYYDKFYNVGNNRERNDTTKKYDIRPVDQSIQLGDGGVGAIITVNGYYNLAHNVSFYGNLYYLLNPRNTNGTRTYLETLSSKYNDDRYYMSVPDQYMARIGVTYNLSSSIRGLLFSAGARIEGLPAKDVLGKSEGWRRPGYVFSFEPTLNYSFKGVDVFFSVPIALQRNRIQSVQDKKESEEKNVKVVGDAAFADYSINIGAIYKF